MSSTKKSKQKNKTFGEKLFGRFSKKKSTKDKKDKKDNKRNGKTKYDKRSVKYDKRTNYNTSKPHKIIDVTPAVPSELKETYTIDDVIHYRSQVIRSVNDEKRKTLVIEKLRLCSVCFDFTQIMDDVNTNMANQQNISDKRKMDGITLSNGMRPSRTLSKKEIDRKKQLTIGIDKKRQMLVEIVEFISTQKWWNEDILREVINCVTANIFRTLPLGSKRKFVKGDEEEEPFFDPQWLHLQLVYELCLRFLISNDIDKKVMQKYLHGSFVLNLIQLFQSEDVRERDYLKIVLHRIYGRFMPIRQQIRTEIANECFRYVYGESRGVHGIAEFLDIFSSIINGFSIPVKEEHKAFLRNVLLPLHKCNKYEVYFQQLADCCVLFVNKEQSIATTVLAGLLKFWPKTSPTKQAFYLREMLNVIGALVEHENGFSYPKYKDIVLLCVDKIFESMESSHFQVADQALSLWKDTVMLYLSERQKDMIWRRLFIIFKNIQLNHWNAGIKQLSNEVVLYYEHIDFAYWKQLKDEYENTMKDGKARTDTYSNGNNTARNSNHKIAIIVPKTLVPDQYHHEKQHKIKEKQKQRISQWKLIRETAQQNRKVMNKTKIIQNDQDNTELNENKEIKDVNNAESKSNNDEANEKGEISVNDGDEAQSKNDTKVVEEVAEDVVSNINELDDEKKQNDNNDNNDNNNDASTNNQQDDNDNNDASTNNNQQVVEDAVSNINELDNDNNDNKDIETLNDGEKENNNNDDEKDIMDDTEMNKNIESNVNIDDDNTDTNDNTETKDSEDSNIKPIQEQVNDNNDASTNNQQDAT